MTLMAIFCASSALTDKAVAVVNTAVNQVIPQVLILPFAFCYFHLKPLLRTVPVNVKPSKNLTLFQR